MCISFLVAPRCIRLSVLLSMAGHPNFLFASTKFFPLSFFIHFWMFHAILILSAKKKSPQICFHPICFFNELWVKQFTTQYSKHSSLGFGGLPGPRSGWPPSAILDEILLKIKHVCQGGPFRPKALCGLLLHQICRGG